MLQLVGRLSTSAAPNTAGIAYLIHLRISGAPIYILLTTTSAKTCMGSVEIGVSFAVVSFNLDHHYYHSLDLTDFPGPIPRGLGYKQSV